MDELYKEFQGQIPNKILDDVKKETTRVKVTKAQLKNILERVKREYEGAVIAPGEAIGIVTAESFGEPATQMSIRRNEKIIVKIKDRIKILKIGQFVDKLMKKSGSFEFKDTEVLPLNDYDFYVPGINQKEKIEWKKVIECSRHNYKKKLMKLTTVSGREIIATDNHSFVVRENNEVLPIVGNKLKIGDRIPVMKYLPEHCIEEIRIKDYLDNIEEKSGMLSRYKTRAKNIPNKIKLDESFGYFTGAYLSEGHANNGQVSISNMDDDFMSNVKDFVEFIGLDCKEELNSRGFALSRDLKISSSLLSQFIQSICSSGSRNKKVPEFAYSAKDKFVSGLLRAYFDGDGNFTVGRKMIRVSSNSKELRDGVALLLSRFKIFSYKTKDKKGQYWLSIPYKYAPLFLQYIGSDIEHKRIALKELTELAKGFWNDKSQDFTDMISGFGNLFYKTAKKLGMRTRYINSFTKRQRIGRTVLFRYMKRFELIAKKMEVDISKELKIMNRMFYSDVIWDAIKNIEYVDHGEKYVYDLSVPGLETFTTFEGIITHNTLNVKHFAGVAEMQVTSGLPRLIEIFDASKSIKTPSMEVFLKSEYSKDAAKVRKIASQIKESMLGDVASEFSIDVSAMNVKIILDKNKLRDIGMTELSLVKVLKDSLKSAQVKSNKNEITLKGKEVDLSEVYALKEKAKNLFIKGVKGISYVLPVKRDGEFIVLTSGSNLKEILKIKEVDTSRTVTNDVHEIYAVFGIEAARQAIINEATKVIQNQGLDIDIRHIMFISDVMTANGAVKGITRSGITGEKESVLARASFETPMKHLMNAALTGELDYLNSVIENVILNQPVPLGTGLPKLIVNGAKKK